MSPVFLLLLAAEVQLYSVPCADIWRAAVPAWSALGLRSVSLDRLGGTAVLAARLTGSEATRRVREWTPQRHAFYEGFAVDVTLTFNSKTILNMECCELRIDPLFQVTWSGSTMQVPSSRALEKSLILVTTRNATKRTD